MNKIVMTILVLLAVVSTSFAQDIGPEFGPMNFELSRYGAEMILEGMLKDGEEIKGDEEFVTIYQTNVHPHLQIRGTISVHFNDEGFVKKITVNKRYASRLIPDMAGMSVQEMAGYLYFNQSWPDLPYFREVDKVNQRWKEGFRGGGYGFHFLIDATSGIFEMSLVE